MHCLAYCADELSLSLECERAPARRESRVGLHLGDKLLARTRFPFLRGKDPEAMRAVAPPAAVAFFMVVANDADVVVDPDGVRAHRRRVGRGHLAHVGDEAGGAEAVERLRRGSVLRDIRLPREARVVRVVRQRVAVPDRRLYLQRRQDAQPAEFGGSGREAGGVRAVLLHSGEGDARREPDFVDAGAVLRELRQGRLPDARRVRLRLAKADRGKRHVAACGGRSYRRHGGNADEAIHC